MPQLGGQDHKCLLKFCLELQRFVLAESPALGFPPLALIPDKVELSVPCALTVEENGRDIMG